mmetsp:Transcript_39012/g.117280  ORF Transcript_39012/g.117280 Transcript_39012/m.117280 type:complete len:92 (-) Transcript_39012:146-421(-)
MDGRESDGHKSNQREADRKVVVQLLEEDAVDETINLMGRIAALIIEDDNRRTKGRGVPLASPRTETSPLSEQNSMSVEQTDKQKHKAEELA